MATFFRIDEFIRNATGQATAGAQVFVCNQPANTIRPKTKQYPQGVPNWTPTPLALLFADAQGIVPVSQPLTADGFGHVYAYAASDFYTFVVMHGGVVQLVLTDQLVGDNAGTTPGVFPQTKASLSHQFLNAYDASTGLFTSGQPAFSDVSGTAGLTQGGTGVDLSSSGGATKILAQDTAHVISARDLVAADIPNLSVMYQAISGKDQPSGYAGLDSSSRLKTSEFAALTGDATSSAGTVATKVVALQNNPVDNAVLGAGQDGFVLAWNNGSSKWVATAPTATGGTNAVQIQGTSVLSTSPTKGETVRFNGSNYLPDFDDNRIFFFNPGINSAPTTSAYGAGFNLGSLTQGSDTGTAIYTDVVPSGSQSFGWKCTTSATATHSAGVGVFAGSSGNNGIFITLGTLRSIKMFLKLNQTANTRVWFGLSDTADPSNANLSTFRSDTPNAKFVGFRYSTAAGDTKYQCVTQTSNVAQTVNAETTATHVDTSTHVFEIRFSGTNAVFLIDGTQVGSQSGNLPSSDLGVGLVMFADNVGSANAQAFSFFGFRGACSYI